MCVEFFETDLCVPFLLQVDGSEYGFCEFFVTFAGRSIAAGNDDNRYLSKIACPANIHTEQYIKAVLFPRLVNWVNLNGVFFNGCGVFKSQYLRDFMFPHGIVSNMADVVASDKFAVDYANGFISWLTKYSLEEIKWIPEGILITGEEIVVRDPSYVVAIRVEESGYNPYDAELSRRDERVAAMHNHHRAQ